jgi:hypothetical protein
VFSNYDKVHEENNAETVQGLYLTNLDLLPSLDTAIHGILLNSIVCTTVNYVLYSGWGEKVRFCAQVVRKSDVTLFQ